MLYSASKSFLFIHVPKTAGTSIRSVLEPYCGKKGAFNYLARRLEQFPKTVHSIGLTRLRTYDAHSTYSDISKIIPTDELNNLFKFCFVRNPYDRAYSYYLHVLGHTSHREYEKIKGYGSFSIMLQNLGEIKEPSQKSYLVNDNNEICVDFIGKLENIRNDFQEICTKFDIDFQLPVKNKRKHKPWQEAYQGDDWKYIAEYYAEDFEAFDYSKDMES